MRVFERDEETLRTVWLWPDGAVEPPTSARHVPLATWLQEYGTLVAASGLRGPDRGKVNAPPHLHRRLLAAWLSSCGIARLVVHHAAWQDLCADTWGATERRVDAERERLIWSRLWAAPFDVEFLEADELPYGPPRGAQVGKTRGTGSGHHGHDVHLHRVPRKDDRARLELLLHFLAVGEPKGIRLKDGQHSAVARLAEIAVCGEPPEVRKGLAKEVRGLGPWVVREKTEAERRRPKPTSDAARRVLRPMRVRPAEFEALHVRRPIAEVALSFATSLRRWMVIAGDRGAGRTWLVHDLLGDSRVLWVNLPIDDAFIAEARARMGDGVADGATAAGLARWALGRRYGRPEDQIDALLMAPGSDTVLVVDGLERLAKFAGLMTALVEVLLHGAVGPVARVLLLADRDALSEFRHVLDGMPHGTGWCPDVHQVAWPIGDSPDGNGFGDSALPPAMRRYALHYRVTLTRDVTVAPDSLVRTPAFLRVLFAAHARRSLDPGGLDELTQWDLVLGYQWRRLEEVAGAHAGSEPWRVVDRIGRALLEAALEMFEQRAVWLPDARWTFHLRAAWARDHEVLSERSALALLDRLGGVLAPRSRSSDGGTPGRGFALTAARHFWQGRAVARRLLRARSGESMDACAARCLADLDAERGDRVRPVLRFAVLELEGLDGAKDVADGPVGPLVTSMLRAMVQHGERFRGDAFDVVRSLFIPRAFGASGWLAELLQRFHGRSAFNWLTADARDLRRRWVEALLDAVVEPGLAVGHHLTRYVLRRVIDHLGQVDPAAVAARLQAWLVPRGSAGEGSGTYLLPPLLALEMLPYVARSPDAVVGRSGGADLGELGLQAFIDPAQPFWLLRTALMQTVRFAAAVEGRLSLDLPPSLWEQDPTAARIALDALEERIAVAAQRARRDHTPGWRVASLLYFHVLLRAMRRWRPDSGVALEELDGDLVSGRARWSQVGLLMALVAVRADAAASGDLAWKRTIDGWLARRDMEALERGLLPGVLEPGPWPAVQCLRALVAFLSAPPTGDPRDWGSVADVHDEVPTASDADAPGAASPWVVFHPDLVAATGAVPETFERVMALAEALHLARHDGRVRFRWAGCDRVTTGALAAPARVQRSADDRDGWLKRVLERGGGTLPEVDGWTPTSDQAPPAVLAAAHGGTGAMLRAAREALDGGVAFVPTRPPSHLAGNPVCLVDHVAAAVGWVREQHPGLRVAIVDVDLHHGADLQEAFAEDAGVLYCSIHQAGVNAPGADLLFIGRGDSEGGLGGLGATVNLPMDAPPAGAGHGAACTALFLDRLRAHAIPAVVAFCPDVVFLCGGTDACAGDPFTTFAVAPEALGEAAWHLRHGVGARGLVVSLEGGYGLDTYGPVGLDGVGHGSLVAAWLAMLAAVLPEAPQPLWTAGSWEPAGMRVDTRRREDSVARREHAAILRGWGLSPESEHLRVRFRWGAHVERPNAEGVLDLLGAMVGDRPEGAPAAVVVRARSQGADRVLLTPLAGGQGRWWAPADGPLDLGEAMELPVDNWLGGPLRELSGEVSSFGDDSLDEALCAVFLARPT